jgi:hypothetical protein
MRTKLIPLIIAFLLAAPTFTVFAQHGKKSTATDSKYHFHKAPDCSYYESEDDMDGEGRFVGVIMLNRHQQVDLPDTYVLCPGQTKEELTEPLYVTNMLDADGDSVSGWLIPGVSSKKPIWIVYDKDHRPIMCLNCGNKFRAKKLPRPPGCTPGPLDVKKTQSGSKLHLVITDGCCKFELDVDVDIPEQKPCPAGAWEKKGTVKINGEDWEDEFNGCEHRYFRVQIDCDAFDVLFVSGNKAQKKWSGKPEDLAALSLPKGTHLGDLPKFTITALSERAQNFIKKHNKAMYDDKKHEYRYGIALEARCEARRDVDYYYAFLDKDGKWFVFGAGVLVGIGATLLVEHFLDHDNPKSQPLKDPATLPKPRVDPTGPTTKGKKKSGAEDISNQ